jgi:macrodomain Ter protein organizer (MatP/YcbG family)
MNTTLTVRIEKTMRQTLGIRARAMGITVSELVRQILEEAITERPIAQRAGHLKGQLKLPDTSSDSWCTQVQERNWRL